MIYQRATKKLHDAGITNINIVKRLYGATPHLIGARKQQSTCFKTPELAADAVLAGFRPTDLSHELAPEGLDEDPAMY